MIAMTRLPGVTRDFRYSRPLIPSRIFWRMKPGAVATAAFALAMVVLLLGLAVAGVVGGLALPVGDRVDPHQERRPQGHDERRGAEGAADEVRVGLRPDVRRQRELLEGAVGDVEPARAARLELTVDVVHVAVGLLVDAGLGDLDQLAALPEEEGTGRADLGAGRSLPLRLALRAEGALPDARRVALVLVLRDVERAGDHAVAAAHAAGRVVGDRARGQLDHRLDRAGRRARGGDPVHALALHEPLDARLLLEAVDDGERLLCRVALLVEDRVALGGRGKLVGLRARRLATPATDAEGRVDEDAWSVQIRLGCASLRGQEARSGRGAGDFEEPSAGDLHGWLRFDRPFS